MRRAGTRSPTGPRPRAARCPPATRAAVAADPRDPQARVREQPGVEQSDEDRADEARRAAADRRAAGRSSPRRSTGSPSHQAASAPPAPTGPEPAGEREHAHPASATRMTTTSAREAEAQRAA